MKKAFICILLLITLCAALAMPASAEDAQQYWFELTVDGQETKEVKTGDIITVVLKLYRTDRTEPYTMYAMQDEIHYDGDFFELVEGSAILSNNINTTDIAMRDNYREFYMNYLSFGGGEKWDATKLIGSFQLRVKGIAGVTKIANRNHIVSLPDGSGAYASTANELTIILSSNCTVCFETNGGGTMENMVVQYGEKLECPKDPTREGMHFVGWYKDIDLEEPWNFETDTVSGNMTLYAKWTSIPADSNPVDGNDPGNENDPGNGESQALWWWLLLLFVVLIVLWWLYNRAKQRTKEEQK